MEKIDQKTAIPIVAACRTQKHNGRGENMKTTYMKPATGKQLDHMAKNLGIKRKVIRKAWGVFPVKEKDYAFRYRLKQILKGGPIGI